MNYQQLEAQFTSGVYPKRELTIVKGKDAVVWDDTGRDYIDCVGGQGVNTLGHANAAVGQAIAEQAMTMVNCPEIFYNDKRALFYQELKSVVPEGLNHFFLSNSGAESMDGAMKFARVSTGRKGYVAAVRAFHGRTMGALTATYEPKYREPFLPLIDGLTHVPYNNLEAMDKAVTEETAAVILEAVQGEGGVHLSNDDYLRGVREICTQRGALLIIDEVQTGFARTGQWFACQHSGVLPDIMTMGKAIGGGVPMGGIAMADTVKNVGPMTHGSTFGGNPLACAAGIASIQEMKRLDLPTQAAEKGAYFMERLEEINAPVIREVRGKGLLIGVELKTKVGPFIKALQAEGVLALPAGLQVLRFLPPAVISKEQIDTVLEKTAKVLAG